MTKQEVKETKEVKAEPVFNLDTPLAITGSDLLKLFAQIQQNQQAAAADQNQALITGLEKLSPHYVPPGQEENIRNQREAQRKIEIFKIKNLRRQQKNCQHEVGQTGRNRLGEGAFCGLKLSTGETIGVCQYCQKVISSLNPDDQKYFRQINGTVAQSGQTEGLLDPINAQLARFGEDERKKIVAAREKYKSERVEVELEDEDLVSL